MGSLTANMLTQMFYALFDQNSNLRYHTLPEPDGAGAAGAAVAVTNNVAADTWGAYAQIAATVGANDIYIVGVQIINLSAAAQFTIAIAKGAAAAEVDIALIPIEASAANTPSYLVILPYPIRVAAGTRVAARGQDDTGGSLTSAVKLLYISANLLGT